MACVSGDYTCLESLTEPKELMVSQLSILNLSNGLTPLATAASAGNVRMVQWLIDQGVDIFQENEWGFTALLAMAASILPGESEEQDSDIDRSQDEICRVLTRAALIQQKNAKNTDEWDRITRNVKELFNARSNKVLGSCNALHFASVRGKKFLCLKLIASGIDVNSSNAEHATPLHLASQCGHTSLVSLLLTKGASLNAEDIRGATSLIVAAYELHSSVIKVLIEESANVEARCSFSNINVLHAVVCGIVKTHRSYFSQSVKKNDLLETLVCGMNPRSLNQIYTHDFSVSDPLYLSTPTISSEHLELYLSANCLLERLNKATEIFTSLIMVCPNNMYTQCMSQGLNPCDLLKHLWERFWRNRMKQLSDGNLQLVAVTNSEREEHENNWEEVLIKINRLISWLKPDKQIIIDPLLTTPRQKKEEVDIPKKEQFDKESTGVAKEDLTKKKEDVAVLKQLPPLPPQQTVIKQQTPESQKPDFVTNTQDAEEASTKTQQTPLEDTSVVKSPSKSVPKGPPTKKALPMKSKGPLMKKKS